MSVVVETTLGDFTVDLYVKERTRASLNFLKLCKIKYYNYNLFHTISRDFIAQTGDPTGSRTGGESIFGVLKGPTSRFFTPEKQPRIKHTQFGLISFVGLEENMIGSQFFITLAPDLTYLDEKNCVFGEVVEGLETIEKLNEVICDTDNRPYQDVRITHTVVLDDPFPDPPELPIRSRSPSPSAERLQGGRIAPDEEIDETVGKDMKEIEEMKAEREAKARATILEMVGDIPTADMAPPENVLFVCKLNPVTTDDDLEIIFSRFGKINSCEVIRDRKTGDSLQYAFIEFDETKSCEDAYFKMDNVLIDDRRIHVDFSQSVAKIKWHGKGRGVTHYDERGKKIDDKRNDLGKGIYVKQEKESKPSRNEERSKNRPVERPERRDNDDYRYKSRDHERDRRRRDETYRKVDKYSRDHRRRSRERDRYSPQRKHEKRRHSSEYKSDKKEYARSKSKNKRKETRNESDESSSHDDIKKKSKKKKTSKSRRSSSSSD